MKPGFRGRYRVQSPKSRVDSSTIGNVIRMWCATAIAMASFVPGRNADICAAPPAARQVQRCLKGAVHLLCLRHRYGTGRRNISVAHARGTVVEEDAFYRAVVQKVAMMLLARDT